MAAGGGVMLIAAGPTLLAVPLTEQLHGSRRVAGAAVAFSAGTLLSGRVLRVLVHVHVPVRVRWPLWGLGMLAGWTLASLSVPALLFAQFVAGIGQAAFEGDTDAEVAGRAGGRRPVTRDLAYAASARSLGGAISCGCCPFWSCRQRSLCLPARLRSGWWSPPPRRC
jgi:hypothetical protein